MKKKESAGPPRIPSDIEFNPDLVRDSRCRVSMNFIDRMYYVKDQLVDCYGVDIFVKTRKREYVAARAAYISFFVHKLDNFDGRNKASARLSDIAEAAGYFIKSINIGDHCSVLYHAGMHEANKKDKGVFGCYYNSYYNLFSDMYNFVFRPDTQNIAKRALIGVF